MVGKKLKHATSGFYRSLAPKYKVIDSRLKKFELADRLIAEASEGFKFVPWMDIQRKLTLSKVIDTRTYRDYIDQNNQINGQAAKVSKTFDYLYDNDIELNIPKKFICKNSMIFLVPVFLDLNMKSLNGTGNHLLKKKDELEDIIKLNYFTSILYQN